MQASSCNSKNDGTSTLSGSKSELSTVRQVMHRMRFSGMSSPQLGHGPPGQMGMLFQNTKGVVRIGNGTSTVRVTVESPYRKEPRPQDRSCFRHSVESQTEVAPVSRSFPPTDHQESVIQSNRFVGNCQIDLWVIVTDIQGGLGESDREDPADPGVLSCELEAEIGRGRVGNRPPMCDNPLVFKSRDTGCRFRLMKALFWGIRNAGWFGAT